MDRIIKKLKETNFIKDGKAYPRFLWLHLNHDQIIYQYNAVVRGFSNYYSFMANYGKLAGQLILYLKRSCCKLLAAKFHIKTMSATYKKFSGDLMSPKEINFIKLFYRATGIFRTRVSSIIPNLFSLKSISNLYRLVYSICSADTKIEMHHIRLMKNANPKLLKFNKIMVKINREQIPLCRNYYMKYYSKS